MYELHRILCTALLAAAILAGVPAMAADAAQPPAAPKALDNPLFVFDNGLRGVQEAPKLLKELGFAGMGASGWKVAPLVQQYEQAGLKVFSTYVGINLDKTPTYDPQAKQSVAELKGSGVVLWLTIAGGKRGQEDEKAAALVREIAEAARQAELRVCLYPHTGFYVATAADALRLAKKVDRKNVGVSINLCHELMTDQGGLLDETIRQAVPHLMLVSINGADAKEPGFGWDRLIQPLGRGNYDVRGFLTKLRAAGYRGPIGLQCYAVKGDPVENLRQSSKAWKEYSSR